MDGTRREQQLHEHAHDPPRVGHAGHTHARGQGGHDHAELRRASGRALRIALVLLSTFFVIELVGGILTNSLALISDAAHLLTDVAAVVLALIAQWFAGRPGSARRSYGYRRVEILAALFNGSTLIAVAGYIIYAAYGRLDAPPEVATAPMIAVASVGLVAQLLTTFVLSRARGESLNVRGAYLHAMTDAVQSVGVIGAGVVMLLTGWYMVDPVTSIAIAAMVAYSGIKIGIEATHVLIEGTPFGVDLDEIAQVMQSTPGVLEVTDLHAWSLTTGYNALTAHVRTDPSADDAGYDELRCRLMARLTERFPLQHVTLQIEKECELCRTGCCGWLEQPEDIPRAD